MLLIFLWVLLLALDILRSIAVQIIYKIDQKKERIRTKKQLFDIKKATICLLIVISFLITVTAAQQFAPGGPGPATKPAPLSSGTKVNEGPYAGSSTTINTGKAASNTINKGLNSGNTYNSGLRPGTKVYMGPYAGSTFNFGYLPGGTVNTGDHPGDSYNNGANPSTRYNSGENPGTTINKGEFAGDTFNNATIEPRLHD